MIIKQFQGLGLERGEHGIYHLTIVLCYFLFLSLLFLSISATWAMNAYGI